MSSISPDAFYRGAVDGNVARCFSTALDDPTPWWMVDMWGTYTVTGVTISMASGESRFRDERINEFN